MFIKRAIIKNSNVFNRYDFEETLRLTIGAEYEIKYTDTPKGIIGTAVFDTASVRIGQKSRRCKTFAAVMDDCIRRSAILGTKGTNHTVIRKRHQTMFLADGIKPFHAQNTVFSLRQGLPCGMIWMLK